MEFVVRSRMAPGLGDWIVMRMLEVRRRMKVRRSARRV